MKRPASPFLPLAAAVGLLVSERAGADGPPVAWWIEAAPWPCARFVGPVARAVEAACDAGGGKCALAATESSATRRLVLFCEQGEEREGGTWRVSGETSARALLWRTSFGGDIEGRPAKIGWFVAHEDRPSSLVLAPASPAPGAISPSGERPLSRAPAAPLVFSPQELPPAQEEFPHARHWDREGGLSLDASFGASGKLKSGQTGSAEALHGVAALSYGNVKLGLAVAYAQGDLLEGAPRTQRWRAGVVVALGAPWNSQVFGCGLEVGASVGKEGMAPPRDGPWGASPYAQWTMVVQIPIQPVRPWIGVSTLLATSEFGDAVQTFSLVGGLAWNAW